MVWGSNILRMGHLIQLECTLVFLFMLTILVCLLFIYAKIFFKYDKNIQLFFNKFNTDKSNINIFYIPVKDFIIIMNELNKKDN